MDDGGGCIIVSAAKAACWWLATALPDRKGGSRMQTITMNNGNKTPQLGYGVFQMSSDEAAGHLLGRAVAERADESIFADDVVDLGKAWSEGMALR